MEATGRVVCLKHNFDGRIPEKCESCFGDNPQDANVDAWLAWFNQDSNKL